MKKTIIKGIALTLASVMSVAGFAQEAGYDDYEASDSVFAEAPAATTAAGTSAGSLALNKSEVTISLHGSDYGEDHNLWVSDMGGSSAKKVKWHSSDTRVVRVNQKGKLFPQGLGTATVTAYTKDGYEGTCEVTVQKYDRAPESSGFRISEQLHGESSVTFGVDLDTGKSGFTNNQNIDFKMEVLSGGATWGDRDANDPLPVWGEIRVVTDGDPIRYMIDSDDNTDPYFNNDSFKIVVDYAKIHIGPAFINLWDRNDTNLGRVNYTTGSDVAYSFMGVDTNRRYGQMVKKPLQSWLSSFDKDSTVYGIQAGYELDGWFKVQGDIASTMRWVAGSSDTSADTAAKDPTDWLYKISADFTAIPYLNIQAGFSNGILGSKSVYAQDMRFGLEADYTWDLFDIYYLKPSLGATFVQVENRGTPYPLIAGGILFGWQDKGGAFDYWGTKYDEDDNGAYPGIAVNVQYADSHIAEKSVYFANTNGLGTLDHNVLMLHGSFNTGSDLLVDGLQAVGAVDVIDLLSDRMVIGGTLGAKYWIPVAGNFSVEPRFLVTRYWDTYNNANDYFFAKACLCLNYSHVHLEFNWESNDLLNGFNDGSTINRFGKFETTFKVNF